MKTFGTITFFVGLLLLVSIVGSSDFYEECRAAADCVAGEEPSMLWSFVTGIFGLILVFVGISAVISADD